MKLSFLRVFRRPGFLAATLLVAGLLAGIWIYARAITPVIGEGYDDSVYVGLGRAIAQGIGYRQIALPDTPPEYHFPPGWPILLSVVWRIAPSFPQNAAGFKIVSAVFAFLTIVVYLRWRRWRGEDIQAGILVVLLTLFTPYFVGSGTSAFSEMAYTCFSILALWLIERYQRLEQVKWGDTLAASVAAAALVYLRSFGVSLFVAAVVSTLSTARYRKRWAYLGLAVAWILPWVLWNLMGAGGGYSDQLFLKSIERPDLGHVTVVEFIARMVFNSYAYFLKYLPGALVLHWSKIPQNTDIALGIIFLSLLIFRIIKRRSVTDWYLLFYVGLALIWPWVDTRFMVPIFILLFEHLVDFFRDAGTVLKKLPARWRDALKISSVALVLLFVALSAVQQIRSVEAACQLDQAGSAWAARLQAFDWIRNNTDESDILAAMDDYQVYLYTGRQVERDLGSVGSLQKYHVKYVVLIPYGGVLVNGDLSHLFFDPVKDAHPGAFTIVYDDQITGIQIYKVDQERLLGV